MRLRREQLLQFLAPVVADRVLADRRDLLAGRQLEVSVLSCDVERFRPFADSHPAEALPILNSILEGIAEVILGQEGTLMSFPGDGALAVFGAPCEGSDHTERAELARAEIAGPLRDRLRARTPGLDQLDLATAVRSGPVLAGVIGAAPRWEYAAIGEATAAAIRATSS